MIRAVVFDFDGVIIDTEKARYDAWQSVFNIYDQELPLQEWIKNIGRASYVVNPFDLLKKLTGLSLEWDDIHQKAKKFELDYVSDIQPLPGVVDRILEAHSNQIRLAVASSSTREWVEGHLKRLSIEHYFSTLVCREDTITHKPLPEPYLTAVKRLGCRPDEALAIEDSPLGIEAAITAGLKCVAVGCSITKELDLSLATRNVLSLEHVSILSI